LCNKLTSDPIVFWTSIIAISTVLYMVYTIRMWKSMVEQVKLNRQIFEFSNRPFLGISEFTVHFTSEGFLNPFFRYSNFGNIPARKVKLKIEYFLNSKRVFLHELELPNSFPKEKAIWGDSIESELTQKQLSSSDAFSFSIILLYTGVMNTIYSTREILQYDYKADSFVAVESEWN